MATKKVGRKPRFHQVLQLITLPRYRFNAVWNVGQRIGYDVPLAHTTASHYLRLYEIYVYIYPYCVHLWDTSEMMQF